MKRTVERDWLVSVGGTLLGCGLLALGVGMVGVTAYELLFASGRPLVSAGIGPRAPVGLALGAAGYFLLRRTSTATQTPASRTWSPPRPARPTPTSSTPDRVVRHDAPASDRRE